MNKSILLAGLLGLVITGNFHRSGATPAAKADAAADRVVAVIHVDVIPPFIDKGRTLLRKYVDETRKDAGASRIELFEDLGRPNHATLVEIWDTRKAYDDHLGLDHTRAFRTDLQPMLGSPFDERLHRTSP